MTNTVMRTYGLAKVLIVSQLRSSRIKNGRTGIWERPLVIFLVNILALVLSWFVTFEIISILPETPVTLLESLTTQVLGFVPILILAIVLLAGIMFELNSSSRFGSSDSVNWLPMTKSEYVAASAISAGYIYSTYLCVAEGVALALSIQTHLMTAWIASFVLSIGALLAGGFFIEILRATINRVYNAMSKKTGRATLIVRLALVIVIIVAFQAVFNPNLLFSLMNRFVGAVEATFFVPLFWPSLTIFAIITGDIARSIIFGSLSFVFLVLVFLIAVMIRSKYWASSQASISFANKHGYAPRYSALESVGFSNVEASIITKDLKGYVRQRELVAFLAMPFVFAAILGIQWISISKGSSSDMSWLVAWFAGFSAIFLSASSIGIEGRGFLNMYMMPLTAKELVRAKAASSLVLSLGGALSMSLVATVLFGPNLAFFLKLLFVSGLVSIQSVFVGLCFATRYSDFAERPRPRYVSMTGMLMAMLIGIGVAVLFTLPFLLIFQSLPYVSLLISFSVFLATSTVAYRYSLRGARALLLEMRT